MAFAFFFQKCIVEDCGEFDANAPWNIEENDETEDVYPPWPDDWDIPFNVSVSKIEEAISRIKDSGNYFFKKKNYTDSGRKYRKALRYIDLLSSRSSGCTKVHSLKVDSLLNLAAVDLKISRHREARNLCDQVRGQK